MMPWGYIIISEFTENVEHDPGDLAITTYLGTPVTREVMYAKIYLRPEFTQEQIVIHEVGHSLGFSHWHHKGHIMNPSMELAGYDDAGLRSLHRQDDGD